MTRLSISRAWDESRVIVQREFQLLAALVLATIALPTVILALVGPPATAGASPLSQVVYIATLLLSFVAQIALCRLATPPSVRLADAIALGFARVVPVVLALIAMLIILGIVALIIGMVLAALGVGILPAAGQQPTPGLVLLLVVLMTFALGVFQLVVPIAAAETGNPVRLVTRSWQLARHHYLRLLGFIWIVVITAVVIAAVTQFGFGSLVMATLGRANPGSVSALILGLINGVIQAAFSVVVAVMLARIYAQLVGHSQAEVGVPNSGM